MADNINVTPGVGSTIAADDVGGVLHQRVKVVIGADGVTNGDVSSSNPMPILASSLPLPSGAATSANQTTANSSLSSIDTKLTSQATSTNQTNGGQKTQIVDGAGLVLGPAIVSGGNNFPIAFGATNYIVSTANSTVAQLASGSTFNGTVETTFNQQSYSILIVTDQPGILTLKNYIDAAGAQLAQSTVFNVPISGFARSGVVNGNYFSISFQNTGPSSTVTLRIDTAYGTIPSATQLNNGPIGLMEINGNSVSTGYGVSNSGVLRTVGAKELSYSAAISNLTMPLLPTDIFTITGSATKVVKIHRLIISGSQSTAANRDLIVLKRSTANSGGTSTTLTGVASDSTSAAATAVVRAYTTNPTVGTLVGVIRSKLWPLLGLVPANNGQFGIDNQVVFNFGELGSQPIVLRGTSEVIAINFNAITSAGSSMYFSIEWTEE